MAMLNINEELKTSSEICDYRDTPEGTLRVLGQLWDIYRESPKSFTTVGFLTESWYEKHYIAADVSTEENY